MAMRSVLAGLVLATGTPAIALAHGLVVFAAIEGDEILVEARFANGQPVRAGEVRVLDARGRELHRLAVAADSPIRLPLAGGEDGLRIDVDAGGGHANYWVLTPDDVAAAAGTAGE